MPMPKGGTPMRADPDASPRPEPAGTAGIAHIAAHPDRAMALEEVHARPPLAIAAPASIAHLVLLSGEDGTAAREHLSRLTSEPVGEGIRQKVIALERTRLKWERHTEFVSYTAVLDGASGEDPLAVLPSGWLEDLPGELLVALRLNVHRDGDALRRIAPSDEPIYGGRLNGGLDVWTTFRPNSQGFIALSMATGDAGADQIGRRVQRLVELETYRIMALLGLPLARRLGPQVSRLEKELAAVLDGMTRPEDDAPDDDTLRRLTRLSAEAEALRGEARFRFSATRAYFALVEARLAALEEDKIGEMQTLGGFIATRLRPAVRTVESLWQRQTQLSDDLSRALSLLRTRIDFAVNRGNQELLDSMNRRHRQQVKIAEAVEGLSVVAISYYALGLIAYGFKALREAGLLPISVELATGLAVPLTVGAVWVVLHWLRRRWERRET